MFDGRKLDEAEGEINGLTLEGLVGVEISR